MLAFLALWWYGQILPPKGMTSLKISHTLALLNKLNIGRHSALLNACLDLWCHKRSAWYCVWYIYKPLFTNPNLFRFAQKISLHENVMFYKGSIPSFVSNLAGECVLLRSVTITEKKLRRLKQQITQQLYLTFDDHDFWWRSRSH